MDRYIEITDSYKHILAKVEGHVWQVKIDTDPSHGDTVVSLYLWSLHKNLFGGYSKTKDNIVSSSFIYDSADREELSEELIRLSVETAKVLSELPEPYKGRYFWVNPLRKFLSLEDSKSGISVEIDYSEDNVLLQSQKLVGLLNDKLSHDIDKLNRFR